MKFLFDKVGNWEKEKNAEYQHFLLFRQYFQKPSFFRVVKTPNDLSLDICCSMCKITSFLSVNPLPHMPILGSSNSAANKDMMSKILTNGDTIFLIELKTLFMSNFSFPTMFSKTVCC